MDFCPHCEQEFEQPPGAMPPATCPLCGKPIDWNEAHQPEKKETTGKDGE